MNFAAENDEEKEKLFMACIDTNKKKKVTYGLLIADTQTT